MSAQPEPPRSRLKAVVGGLAWRVPFYLAVVASLLVFPSALPWMLGFWLAVYASRAIRRKSGWPPLALAVLIVLLKRVDWAPGLVALGLLMIAVAVADGALRKRPPQARSRFAAGAAPLLVIAWLVMAWSWHAAAHTTRHPALQGGRPVVCIGDSLTASGYPRALQAKVRVPVLDLAMGGITASEGLERLPEVLSLRPQVVVVELGGHDYLQGRSRRETKANLEKIIRATREAGAEVILFEVPRGFIWDPFGGLERELARAHDLELIGDGAIRSLVLWSPATPLGGWTREPLSDDGLHPNERGHVFLADRVAEALRRLYGDAILIAR